MTSRVRPVSTFLIVTEAPGISAPVASLTLPEIVPPVCAIVTQENKRQNPKISAVFLCISFPPRHLCFFGNFLPVEEITVSHSCQIVGKTGGGTTLAELTRHSENDYMGD